MKQQFVRIRPHQAGEILGILYFLVGFRLVPLLLLAGVWSSQGGGSQGVLLAFAIPVLYGLFGYASVPLFAVIHNELAGFVGGLEVELSQVPPAP